MSTIYKSIKRKERIKQGKSCVYCNCDNPLLMTVDHITPKSRGGKDTKDNMQPCCIICNSWKGALKDSEFCEYMKALKILHKLCKAKLAKPVKLPEIKISLNHHPEFDFYSGFNMNKAVKENNNEVKENDKNNETR